MTTERTRANLAVLIALFRVFTVVAVFQLSGGAHMAGDLVEYLRFGDHIEEPEEKENDPNHSCPPGCPTCHHVHYSWASLPPTVLTRLAWVPISEGHVVSGVSSEHGLFRQPVGSVFRPPRT